MNDKTLPSGNRLKILGFIAVALGIICFIMPVVASTSVVVMVGLVMIIAGVSQLLSGFKGTSWRDRIMPMVLGGITGLAGVLVLAHPLLGLTFLTLLLACFFLFEGVWKIIASFKFRPQEGWTWLLLSGVLSLVLGWLIWSQWPLSGVWAIGILVGVNLLTTGLSLVVLGSAVKKKLAS